MRLDIIKDRLSAYHCQTPLEESHALKEISQEIILMALARHDFFNCCEFHGGTALRILYGLQHFSEDLDFALLIPDIQFSLTPYLDSISDELSTFGYAFEIKDRSKADSIVKKAFLKDDSVGKLLEIKQKGASNKIIIKLEIDSNPPLGADTEFKYLDFPYPFGIRAKNLPSSFSGKLHALLCRRYIKGRDWYDFIWYVSKRIAPNVLLLKNALKQNGPWEGQNIIVDTQWIIGALRNKVESINWKQAKQDISTFIKSNEQAALDVWGDAFFLAQVDKLEKALG
ncbi:MAG: hypothetical protein COB66_02715 [Coxiella sp. (in: Bacteria)]|nr:MAG: hypothetical protein COB66_02715 [Coxiella sp. (in: g-proteobacteria)]